jgi:hypothetical protein
VVSEASANPPPLPNGLLEEPSKLKREKTCEILMPKIKNTEKETIPPFLIF